MDIMKRRSARVLPILAVLAVSLFSCGKGSGKNVKIDGVIGPNVSFVDGKFTMSVVLQNVGFDGGARIPIPKMPNSYVEVGPDLQSNGLLISTGLDSKDLIALTKGKVNSLDPLTLPGGRPLPGVSTGWLPGLALEVPKWDHMVFYVGTNVFGIFVPVKLPWQNYIGTFRFYDPAGDAVGNLSIVGQDANKKNAGILLLINLQGKIAGLMGQT